MDRRRLSMACFLSAECIVSRERMRKASNMVGISGAIFQWKLPKETIIKRFIFIFKEFFVRRERHIFYEYRNCTTDSKRVLSFISKELWNKRASWCRVEKLTS